MYILRNAMSNINRNKGRILLIGIVTTALIAVATVAFSINTTTNALKEDYKERFGSEVFVQPDFEKIQESNGTMMFEDMSNELKVKLGKSEHLKESTFIYSAMASGEDIDPIEDEKSANGNGGMSMAIPNDGGEAVNPEFQIKGYSHEKDIRGFANGERKLTSGSLTEEANAAIISENLAKENDLKIGDSLKLKLLNGEIIELKITGLYQDMTQEEIIYGPVMDPKNEIIVTFATLETMANKDKDGNSIWLDATYMLKNPDLLEAFTEEARAQGMPESMKMATDEMSYNQIVKPMETISESSMLYLTIILVFGAGLLITLSVLTVRERKYEIGVLRAMGMKRGRVARGLIYESLITTGFALLIGIMLGAMVSKPVGDYMLANPSKNDNMGYGVVMMNSGGNNDVEETKEFNPAFTPQLVAQVSGLALVISMVATSVGVIYVMRHEPMQILAERN
ncbi:FtsX-like permease family protein [Erysipelothrix sp. HDW6C]|uniref:ABC transporter permease n=1 Tax=Erysipelothrix sp. HDW6C TaxID=2714930 RepID=UPI00140C4C6B|nr:FtsX-like permease family protein [Erysipelothrix sp. HDW6C]QIK68823.1 FtsX-like permease family protein [Erysipelothrix sp. HDW6C]